MPSIAATHGVGSWYSEAHHFFNLCRVLSAVCFLGAWSPLRAQDTPPATAAVDLPDVVFIISDDQAWSDYSFMDHPHIQTPQIDQLARESLLFTRGYVPDSLCRPSLATMISGLYPHQHGIVGNDPPPYSTKDDVKGAEAARGRLYRNADYQKAIEEYLRLHIDRMQTLPDRLKSLGYVSLQTGKWWEGNYARGGFDAGMTHGDHQRGGRHGDEGLKIGRNTMQPIEDFVSAAKQDGNPYFLWYAPFLPHTPHNPPQDLLAKYQKLTDSPAIAKYWAMCEWFDQSVGELRKIISTRGRADSTLIVYVCDNGWINLPDRSAYAPKSKRSQYDGGVRTPIMIHWPKRVPVQRDEMHLASSIDLVPTVMKLVGLPPDEGLPGIDLTDAKQVAGRQAVFGEILEHDVQSMNDPATSLMYRWVISGKWKLIIPTPHRVPDGEIELYDLSADPWETKNLAQQTPRQVAQLRSQLDQWWSPATSK
ncbi:MAG: sulfatase [Pirellulaceae bacterium]